MSDNEEQEKLLKGDEKDLKGEKAKKKKDEPRMPQPGSGSVAMPNIAKRGFKGFWRDVQREMRHVTWPTRAETNRLTGVVLAVSLLAIVVLWALSFLFQTVFDILLRR